MVKKTSIHVDKRDMATAAHRALRRERWPVAALVAAALAVGWASSARLVATPDSMQYLVAARSMLDGHRPLAPSGEPFTQFGVVFPLSIAAIARLGLSLPAAARVVVAGSLVVSAFSAGVWTRQITGSRTSAIWGGAIAIAIWPAAMTRFLWSESLFIALVLAAGACLSTAVARRSLVRLAVGGALLGLASATRYSGLALLLVGAPVAWRWSSERRAQLRAASVFVASGVVGVGPWVLHNLALDPSEPLGPRPSPVYSPREVLAQAVAGLLKLAAPGGASAFVVVVLFSAAAASLVVALRSLRGHSSGAWWSAAGLPFLFAALYLAATVVGGMTTRVDALHDDRLLVPCAPLLAVGIVGVVWSAISATDRLARTMAPRLRATSMGVPVLGLMVLAATTFARDGVALRPTGSLSPSVLASPLFDVTGPAAGSDMVSNDPALAAWVLDSPVLQSPADDGSGRRLVTGDVLLWTVPGLRDLRPLDSLRAQCRLEPRGSFAEGRRFSVGRCRPRPGRSPG